MKVQKVGYIRVSTLDQSAERQLEGVELDKVFTDHASGKDTNRPQLIAALAYLRDGDTLLVHSMDRLARNVEDVLRVVRELKSKGVTVQFMKEGMAFTPDAEDPRANLMFFMLGAFAQFERALLRERQREGIAIAKSKGMYKGRRPSLDTNKINEIRERIAAGGKRAKLAKEYGVSRATLYQYLRDPANACT
jgi:DNA invertase Pin-like site-specific DNA recombinase